MQDGTVRDGDRRTILENLNRADQVLEILTPSGQAGADLDESVIAGLLEKRANARAAKDLAASDAIRDELKALGVTVKDTPEGPVWRRERP